MQINANAVIDNLSLQIAQQAKEIAILQAQIETLKSELSNKEDNN